MQFYFSSNLTGESNKIQPKERRESKKKVCYAGIKEIDLAMKNPPFQGLDHVT
jgi:hypothetical protein